MKIPPKRRKTAYSSLRRIAKRLGLRFTASRVDQRAFGGTDPEEEETSR